MNNPNQFNYSQQLEHRLKMIADDIEVIKHFIQEQNLEKTFENTTQLGGASAWANIHNIDIACDLNNDESLTWGMML